MTKTVAMATEAIKKDLVPSNKVSEVERIFVFSTKCLGNYLEIDKVGYLMLEFSISRPDAFRYLKAYSDLKDQFLSA